MSFGWVFEAEVQSVLVAILIMGPVGNLATLAPRIVQLSREKLQPPSWMGYSGVLVPEAFVNPRA